MFSLHFWWTGWFLSSVGSRLLIKVVTKDEVFREYLPGIGGSGGYSRRIFLISDSLSVFLVAFEDA